MLENKRAYYFSQSEDNKVDNYEKALRVHTIMNHRPLGVGHHYADNDQSTNTCGCGHEAQYIKISSNRKDLLCYNYLLVDFIETPMSHWSRYMS